MQSKFKDPKSKGQDYWQDNVLFCNLSKVILKTDPSKLREGIMQTEVKKGRTKRMCFKLQTSR